MDAERRRYWGSVRISRLPGPGQRDCLHDAHSPDVFFYGRQPGRVSGLSNSMGALSGNGENSTGYATDQAFIAGILSGNQNISDYTGFLAAGYTNWGDFFKAVLSWG